VLKTSEISLVDGDDTALAKIGRSLFLKIVSTVARRERLGGLLSFYYREAA
jgi:hypothetical protein